MPRDGTEQIAIPDKLIDLFEGPADVRGAHGGRGSAKTRTFAKMTAVRGYMFGKAGISGILLCGRQFMNSLADSSFEEVERAIKEEPFLAAYYEITERTIASRDGRIEYAFAGLDRSIQSIKSKGRILLCWVDEAEPVVADAWTTLIPTLREEGEGWNAELWVTWNRKRKKSAVDALFLNSRDPLIRIVEMNWRDNPKFPAILERARQRDLEQRPDQYEHIWEGALVSIIEGAYYAKCLTLARSQGRIGRVAADPLMTIRLFCDIGGTGKRADAFTIWAMQFIGREIRVLNYYEAVGQPLSAHLAWCRAEGYTPGVAQFWLPHDGDTNDTVFDVNVASAIRAAGWAAEVVPNQGAGAAMNRVEAGRRLFPSMWFNEATTAAGIEALGWYHEKRDDDRDIGLGPEHDWSSHGADGFGLGCVVYETPKDKDDKKTREALAKLRKYAR